MQLSWGCEEQLFRQELEDSDDIRLSVRLYTRCIREKRKFCGEVAPGERWLQRWRRRWRRRRGPEAVVWGLCEG